MNRSSPLRLSSEFRCKIIGLTSATERRVEIIQIEYFVHQRDSFIGFIEFYDVDRMIDVVRFPMRRSVALNWAQFLTDSPDYLVMSPATLYKRVL